MKLFITNKKYFTDTFDATERFVNTNREPLTSSQIHKLAYNELKNSLDQKYSIPLGLTPPYDNGEGCCVFFFVNKKDDVYFYEYNTTAS